MQQDAKAPLFIILITLLIVYFLNFYNKPQDSSEAPSKDQIELNNATSNVDFVTTENYANQQLKYYYVIPESVIKSKSKRVPFLVVVPGLGGNGADLINYQIRKFIQDEGFIIIAPTFIEDSQNFDSQTSYQYPAAWSGAAMNKILNTFVAKQNLQPTGIYLLGFSAGAQFVSRYAQLYPDYITACAFNAAGSSDNPNKYQKTKFFVAVGKQDEDYRKTTARDFYDAAKKVGIDVSYQEYNVGHQLSDEEISQELDFFRTVKNNNK